MKRNSIEVNNKTLILRIRARHVKTVQEKLDGKSFSDALFDLMDSPVAKAAPFLWGVLHSQDTAEFSGDEYALYDALVDAGYGPEEFADLVIDICEGSGFFTAAQVTALRKLPKAMAEVNRKLLETTAEKLLEINAGQKPKPSKNATNPAYLTVTPPENTGTAPTEKPATGSEKPSKRKQTE